MQHTEVHVQGNMLSGACLVGSRSDLMTITGAHNGKIGMKTGTQKELPLQGEGTQSSKNGHKSGMRTGESDGVVVF